MEPRSGHPLGTSVYLFDSEAAARRFLAGPTLENLLNDVSRVSFDLTHVEEAEQRAMATAIAWAPESRAAS